MRNLLGIAAFLCCVSFAAAQPAPTPPVFKIVGGVDKEKGYILFVQAVNKAVPVTVEKIVIVNNVEQRVLVTEYRYVVEEVFVTQDVAKCKFLSADGKLLPMEQVWKRLKANMVVVASTDGNAPHQVFLKALHADTLVVLLPPTPNLPPSPPRPGIGVPPGPPEIVPPPRPDKR